MGPIQSSIAWLAHSLNKVSSICIIAMMALSCLDIILRLLRMPLPGTYEIVGFLSALMLSLSMAQTTIERGHVAVEVLMSKMPQVIQRIFYVLTNAVIAAVFVVLAWETIKYGNFYKHSGELSLTLQFAFYPILYAMGIAFGISALVPMVDVAMVVSGKQKIWFDWEK